MHQMLEFFELAVRIKPYTSYESNFVVSPTDFFLVGPWTYMQVKNTIQRVWGHSLFYVRRLKVQSGRFHTLFLSVKFVEVLLP